MTEDFISQLLGAPDTKEALGWLRTGSEENFRTIGALETNAESIELVELIYRAGATEVLAVEIDEFPEGQNTGTLVVRLPNDSTQRKRLLEWANTLAEQQGFESEDDTGQPYIFLTLD